jgi:PEP-CTERM motif
MSKSKLTTIVLGAMSLAGAVMVSAAADATQVAAPTTPFYISYTIELQNYAVSDILLFEQGEGASGYGITWDSGFNAPVGTTTLTDPFLKTNPIVDTFLIGLTTDLPGDAPGQEHLVLFTNDAFASSAQGIDWDTLFPNTNETTLINDLLTGDDFSSDLFGFSAGDAVNGPNGSIAFVPGDTFTAIAFSNGFIIGSGNSFITNAAVPEPATWTMMLIGLCAVAGTLGMPRRKIAPSAA